MKRMNRNVPLRVARRAPHLGAVAVAVLLAGCSLTPEFKAPEVDVPSAWKEAPASAESERGSFKPGEPSEHLARGEWWKSFGDPQLDSLIDRAMEASPTLAAAAARVKQARAVLGVSEADRWPQGTIGAEAGRRKLSAASFGLPEGSEVPAANIFRVPFSISYEADLFGRVSSSVAAARRDAESTEATFQSVRLALQADVAQTWISLRQTEAELQVLRETVATREENVNLLQKRFDHGDIGELDLVRAKTELATTQSEAVGLERTRATLQHGLAVLLGQAPANFTADAQPLPVDAALPAIPTGLPSTLLERRPDIVAAQRTMEAANERIGVARSAFFPSLTLTGNAGTETTELSNLFKWSTRTWLIDGLLSLPIFDGGRNRANLDRSRAVLEQTVAEYRGSVLNAFAQVEDNLAALRVFADQARLQAVAVETSRRAAQLADKRYRAGYSSYFEVIDAERSLLNAERTAVVVQGARANATVALVRALGGGWDSSAPMAAR